MLGIILPLGAFLIAVLLVAALWLWWSGDSHAEPIHADGDANALSAFDITPTMTAPPPAAPAAAVQSESSTEVMRIIRGPDGINVVMSGTTYRSMGDFANNPASRSEFMSTLRALAQFSQTAENGSAASPVVETPSVMPAPAPAMKPPQPASTRVTTTSKMADDEAAAQEAEKNSMAGQIEERLQARLIRTPGMETRSIHIHSAPHGGVEITVDGLVYESVGDITDEAARSVIEAAIRDWEAANPI